MKIWLHNECSLKILLEYSQRLLRSRVDKIYRNYKYRIYQRAITAGQLIRPLHAGDVTCTLNTKGNHGVSSKFDQMYGKMGLTDGQTGHYKLPRLGP